MTRKLLLGLALLGAACSFETTAPTDPIVDEIAASVGGRQWGPETPQFNLEAILTGTGFGLVRFRQPNDAELRIYLDLWVRDLKPNTTYLLERAVDLDAPDDVCSSTAWLTLGSVDTDADGTGRAALSRLIPATLLGVEFDIHFHVIEPATGEQALVSDCYQYTVSM